ncbi:transcription antitermination factor NusB [Rhodocyclus tenuis]|uniref:Transcription antitermination protein NusB n=2 Tax=Rhodocyclus TaxID=1064 RepID=A0A6L5JWX6_RHOTE|nr:transcription antitermination factor NusB [Rhodocyclus gracilis]MQY51877.1 transcription antitermination factor NusB [Rhodocyclus gracilis]MRD73434.1 transcription antitermination factor NusB [Rhodocyclus gracilis]NJA88456.1 transcription antitermination factor NusB [Rhodocyclus gracilis]
MSDENNTPQNTTTDVPEAAPRKSGGAPRGKAPARSGKSPRRLAREFAMQGLYQWRVGGADEATIEAHVHEADGFHKANGDFYRALLRGVMRRHAELQAALEPFLDRPFAELSPVESSILLAAAFELETYPETPYRVIINEAIELAKGFGGADGHKFVNGVLDKLAARLRPEEVAARRAGR